MNLFLQLLIAELVKQAPALVIDIIRLLSKPDVSDADWADLKAKWKTSYDEHIADAEHR